MDDNFLFDIIGAKAMSDEATVEEIASYVKEKFETCWRCGYTYEVDAVRRYTGGPMPKPRTSGHTLPVVEAYCSEASRVFLGQTSLPIPELLRQETLHWENEGGICIYISVLAYCLFLEFGIFSPEDMHLIQGLYRYRLRADWPSEFIPFGNIHAGTHAFLSVRDAVVDFSLMVSEGQTFDFGETEIPFVAGEVPELMGLYGWPEELRTVKEYARQFAKQSGMVYVDWIRHHKQDALQMISDALEQRITELKGNAV